MYDVTPSAPYAAPAATSPDLDSFARLDSLGLSATRQQVFPGSSVLRCAPSLPDDRCPGCGRRCPAHDYVTRRLAHLPLGRRATWLSVRVPRYRCAPCGKVWRHRLLAAARPRARLTRAAEFWALCQVVLDHAPVSAVAKVLGVSWGAAHDAVAETGTRLLINHPGRLGGVKAIGVDEHAWRHTRKGDKYVTVVIDLTAVRDGEGPARLLDMVEGRSKKAFKDWLESQTPEFRNQVEVVSMDGFTGYKTAAAETLPAATAVMDPFHVVALAAEKLDQARQRVQRATTGRRGTKNDPLYKARRTLKTGANLLNDRQWHRLKELFADERHAALETTWAVYQKTIDAYRDKNKTTGRATLAKLIDDIKEGVPEGLEEITTLGHTMNTRRADILAYFDHPRTSNGPTEAINGRLEHLRGTALGFRNIINYKLRSLLETGGFRPLIHSLS
jgi:transposase